MAEKQVFTLEYSPTSLKNALDIVAYLRNKFSEREFNRFYLLLIDFEHIVIQYPTLYNESQKRNIRRAVLSKELSIFYMIRKDKISIVAIIDNRWDLDRIII